MCIWSERQTPGIHSGQPQVVNLKVVWYDSLMIKIPIIGGLTNCLASGELLSEATVIPHRQRNTGRGEAELRIINLSSDFKDINFQTGSKQ